MEVILIELTERQKQIIKIVKDKGPITGENISDIVGVVRSTLRPDFTILTKSGFLEARPRIGYYFTGKRPSSLVVDAVKKFKVDDWKAVSVVVSEDDSVYGAIVKLFHNDVGTLYIVGEGGILEGVVSRKDLLKIVLGQADIQKIPINIIMTRMPNVVTINAEDSLWSAAKKIVDHEIDSLPVVRSVSHNGREGLKVIGRITKTTITNIFVQMGQSKIKHQEKE